MANYYRCPKCGGRRIQPDIGDSFGYPPKGVSFIPTGNECFCDLKQSKLRDFKMRHLNNA